MRSLAVLLLCSLCGFAAHAGAWAVPGSAETDLHNGKAWAEVRSAPNGLALIHAAIDIPAPAKTVWLVMNDCRLLPRLITSTIGCRVLQADPARLTDVRETVTRGNFFLPTLHNVVREDFQPFSLIRFAKAGGDLKAEQGEWRLLPIDGGAGTRVVYENLVGADILAPASLVRVGMRRDTAKVLGNLRRESMAAAKS